MANSLVPYLEPLPLIAVLRGITPEAIPSVGAALAAHGFRILEVPLNSPRPYDSIRALVERFGERCLVGAGTVLDVEEVARVEAVGGRLIVMPHGDVALIREAKRKGRPDEGCIGVGGSGHRCHWHRRPDYRSSARLGPSHRFCHPDAGQPGQIIH